MEQMDTKSKQVDVLPIVKHYITELELHELFDKYVPNTKGFEIQPAQVLCLMIMNIVAAPKPMYKVDEWLSEYMDGRTEHIELAAKYNDDRLGRCLDALFHADRHSLMAESVIAAIKVHEIECDRIHNDSTSITFAGAYEGSEGSGEGTVQIVRGYNKDGRPDCKQIVFGLNITEDGHVPLSYQLFDGNQADVTTHIPNWNGLREFLGTEDFIYIGDSKVCSTDNMNHIAGNNGFFITLMPRNRKEATEFTERLRQGEDVDWQEGYIKENSRKKGLWDVYKLYDDETSKEGFRIIWVHSSSKEKKDGGYRINQIEKAENSLQVINEKLNKYNLKTKEQIDTAVDKASKGARKYLTIEVIEKRTTKKVKIGPGRPSSKSVYEDREFVTYALKWCRNKVAIEQDTRKDGVFPLITNTKLSAVEVLQTYKKQPFLEKRFQTKKSVLEVAPVFINKPSRVEAMMFLYFIALMIVSLVERHVRREMINQNLESLKILPSRLCTKKPTWNNIQYYFRNVHLSLITKGNKVIKTIIKGVTKQHLQLLKLLKVPEEVYGRLLDGWWVFNFR